VSVVNLIAEKAWGLTRTRFDEDKEEDFLFLGKASIVMPLTGTMTPAFSSD
jgi:hypothetical protein